ncbi:hypothetical protein JET18_07915 [Chryseobacterium sp. L7]|uniref:Uncharacterized protein n=1 Tax=Chryseobacterium endalhagicum TaxID=2797638 RepID=A0ABS1QEK9_9FLAO|nr:hypothetical protein [Chryseobacterium endalhagicum]MBL1220757.1 hypothetical protein [Chryseobacterium endalhagicum]
MKRNTLLPIILLLFLTSCSYSEKQQAVIEKITKKNEARFDEGFRKNLLDEFSKGDIIRLSSDENPELALYFYRVLLEKYPEECFDVLMKNLDNKKQSVISTSYDTLNEMTVPEAMMFWESQKNIFTKDQKKKLFETILADIEHRTHLDGYIFMYLLDHEKNPDPAYYPAIKKMITKGANHYMGNFALLNYFTNYNKPEDSLIIKDFLKKNISEDSDIHMNISVEYIRKHPKPSYLSILQEFYDKRVKGEKIQANNSFFELEDLTKATLQYKTESAKKLMNDIAYKTSFTASKNNIAAKEHIYYLLKKYDTSDYFSEITNDFEKKADKVKLDSLTAWHKRWDRHMQ